MSMYGDYVRERLGDEILEFAYGFATFRFIEQDGVPCVYIVDIYVKPEFRKSKVASEMADQIVLMGKNKECKMLLGTVSPRARNATDSLKVLLGYGMVLHSCSSEVIIFKKEI